MLRETVSEDDRLASLKALRDDLAKRLDECDSARDYSSMSQRLMDCLKQIAEIEGQAAPRTSVVDDLAKRRRTRKRPVRDGEAARG